MLTSRMFQVILGEALLKTLYILVTACFLFTSYLPECRAVTGGTIIDEASATYRAIGTVESCTGTLITPRLVLTAAHCVCYERSCQSYSSIAITYVHDGQLNTVSFNGRVRVHPVYQYILSRVGTAGPAAAQYMGIDLAVIELDIARFGPTQTPYYVSPIPLANPGNMPRTGDALTLVGTAETSSYCAGAEHKAKTAVPVSRFENSSRLVTFEDPVRHACPGDSGGPVLNSNGRIVGVMKQGGNSVTIAHPTSIYYDWILTGSMKLAETTMMTEANITRGADKEAHSYSALPLPVNNPSLCFNECAADSFCNAWEYTPSDISGRPFCWLTTTVGTPSKAAKGRLSGLKVVPANQLN